MTRMIENIKKRSNDLYRAGPLTFYPNSPGEPFIEVDPPRGDPRLPTNQQQPPYPTPPRWRPVGSPRWLPWNDPTRPMGLRPDPTSFPPENIPFPYGPNGLNSLPTGYNSNLGVPQRITDKFLPEKCMECRFNARIIRDIVDASKKELLQELAPSMRLAVYERNNNRIVEKTFKALGTADTKASLQQLYRDIAELQDKSDDAFADLELIKQLLSSPPDDGDDAHYIQINVPVARYQEDGSVLIEQQPITVNEREEAEVRLLFQVLADARMREEDGSTVRKIYKILGGDSWYSGGQTEPRITGKWDEQMRTTASTLMDLGGNEQTKTATNLQQLIQQYLAPFAYRLGLHDFPTEVPSTLLTYTDKDALTKIKTLTDYLGWYVQQFDALVGQFPIEITIEDIDPLTKGNQTKKIELSNISEALAEMYGMNTQISLDSSVAVNFLMRLASEVIATKNSSLITQDYVKANAAFLGYKGNPKKREINYSFNPTKLDTLEEFLQETKAFIVGWDEDDPESIVGYLQKIVFAAGIIKAAFMRGPKELNNLQKELNSMTEGNKEAQEKQWQATLEFLNNPNGFFNRDGAPLPKVKDKDGQK